MIVLDVKKTKKLTMCQNTVKSIGSLESVLRSRVFCYATWESDGDFDEIANLCVYNCGKFVSAKYVARYPIGSTLAAGRIVLSNITWFFYLAFPSDFAVEALSLVVGKVQIARSVTKGGGMSVLRFVYRDRDEVGNFVLPSSLVADIGKTFSDFHLAIE